MLQHLIQTREFPVDDTTAVARSDTDETATVRLELGSVSTGTNLVWTVPNQNLDFTPDSGDFSASGGGGLPVADTTAIVKDPSTATKRMRIDVGAVSADTTRVLTMPDANVDLTVGSGTFNKYVHPDHTGDVTSSADGAQTIAADAVTYAKMQNVTGTDKFLGRDSSGAGVIEEIAASAARTILNVEDGADVTDTTNVNSAAATTVGTVTTGVWSATDVAVVAGGTGSSSASGARTNLGVAIGSNVQAFGAVLDDFNSLGVVSSDGQIIVGTGSGAFAYESGATARTSLGLTIGTHVQAWDNDLDDIAALTPTKGKLLVGNGTDWINLSLGDDDEVLTADASETSGTKWAEAGGGGGIDVQVFTSTGTWTKPASAQLVTVELWGGGGGGGGAGHQDAGYGQGGAGGGGGAYATKIYDADLLGGTEAVTIGAGGAGGAGLDNSPYLESVGGTGGSSIFGGNVTAYGGGAGGWTYTYNSGGGGGAAGTTTDDNGGEPKHDIEPDLYGGGDGNNGGGTRPGKSSIYGGGGGGEGHYNPSQMPGVGGSSLYGGGGGGGGNRQSPPSSHSAGSAGGSDTLNSGGGGAGGSTGGGAGSAGAVMSSGAGSGGGGGGSNSSGQGGAGGAGGAPSGGGGGGGGSHGSGNVGGAGGAGGAGKIIVYTTLG